LKLMLLVAVLEPWTLKKVRLHFWKKENLIFQELKFILKKRKKNEPIKARFLLNLKLKLLLLIIII
jgi:hypothetical protein